MTFNGIPAALLYVSTTQINALAPAGIAAGPVQVVVRSNGVASAPFTILATATQPAIFAVPNSNGSSFFAAKTVSTLQLMVGTAQTNLIQQGSFESPLGGTWNFDVHAEQGAAPRLGDGWQRYVVYFQATATDLEARVNFDFGDQAGNVWLDSIVLQ